MTETEKRDVVIGIDRDRNVLSGIAISMREMGFTAIPNEIEFIVERMGKTASWVEANVRTS